MNIACVGTGTVGRSWAIVFARAGYDTRLWDASLDAMRAAEALITATLSDLERAGNIASVQQVLARIQFAPSLVDAVTDASYVQESISERVSTKQLLFRELDTICAADTIIASSTSAIPGSQFMTGLSGSRRYLVAHPVNPPHLIPLVELCPTNETNDTTIQRTAALLKAAGQKPVRLNREVEGFLLNRLQWALMMEAMHLIGEGYCTAEDINTTMTSGLALRWAHIGPLAVAHLNADQGLTGYFSGLGEAINRVQDSLQTDYKAEPETIARCHEAMVNTMPVEQLTDFQTRRDRNILALRQFLNEME